MKLIRACVLGYNGNYPLEEVLNDSGNGEKSIDDLEYDDVSGYDYMSIGLIDIESKVVYFLNDNIHTHPSAFIEGFIKALESFDKEYTVEDKVIVIGDLAGYDMSGVR